MRRSLLFLDLKNSGSGMSQIWKGLLVSGEMDGPLDLELATDLIELLRELDRLLDRLALGRDTLLR